MVAETVDHGVIKAPLHIVLCSAKGEFKRSAAVQRVLDSGRDEDKRNPISAC